VRAQDLALVLLLVFLAVFAFFPAQRAPSNPEHALRKCLRNDDVRDPNDDKTRARALNESGHRPSTGHASRQRRARSRMPARAHETEGGLQGVTRIRKSWDWWETLGVRRRRRRNCRKWRNLRVESNPRKHHHRVTWRNATRMPTSVSNTGHQIVE
jgi:hypothetical protein